MVIEISRRQVDDLFRRAQASLTAGIGECDERVGIGDIELALGKRHAEGRIEAFREGSAKIGDTVAVGIAQKRDPVGAWRCGTRSFHRQLHECLFEAEAFVVLGRCIGFGHQHVAVRQYMQPARVIEARSEGVHLQPFCGCRRGAFLPAFCVGDVDGRDHRGVRLRQSRIRAVADQARRASRISGRNAGAAGHKRTGHGDDDQVSRNGSHAMPSRRDRPLSQ